MNGAASAQGEDGAADPADQAAPPAAPPTSRFPTSAGPRKPATPGKAPKKDNDTNGLAVAVALPAANQQVLPLQFRFPPRDGNEQPQGETTDGKAGAPTDPNLVALAASTAPAPLLAEEGIPGSAHATAGGKAAKTAPTEGTGAAAAKGELAFAARVQPAAPTKDIGTKGRQTSDTQQSAASASALRKASSPDAAQGQDIKDAGQPAEPTAAAQHVVAAFEQSVRTSDTQTPPKVEAPTAPAQMAPVQAESPVKSAVPLRDLSMQLTQPGAEKVEVRLVQQAGEVHVAVRTGDTDLAHGLRQGLPELVGKLEDGGYRAEAWRPTGGTAGTAPLSQSQESQTASGQSHYGDSQGRQGGSQQDGGQRNQNPFNRPRWVEELESSITGGEPTGETNGIAS